MIKKHNKYEGESLIKVKNEDLLGTISTKIAYFAVQNAWRLDEKRNVSYTRKETD